MPHNLCKNCRHAIDSRSHLCRDCWAEPAIRLIYAHCLAHVTAQARQMVMRLNESRHPPCVHCHVRPGHRPRRLCTACWYDRDIRQCYDCVKPNCDRGRSDPAPSRSRTAPSRPLPMMDDLSGEALERQREARIEEMARRFAAGEELLGIGEQREGRWT